MNLKILLVILILTVLIVPGYVWNYFNTKKEKNCTIKALTSKINLISDNCLKDFVNFYFTRVPKSFWVNPASMSGKYHPKYALGKGGLVRHTKAAVQIAESLLSLEMYEDIADKKDLIIIALLLHDTVKTGFEGQNRTQSLHPKYACELIDQTYEIYKEKLTEEQNSILSENLEKIKTMILSHMGQWNTDKNGKEILPKPEKKLEKFVHLCDYLASRKFLNVDMEE